MGPHPRYGEIVRGGIQNMDTGEWMKHQLNPRQFQISISPQYASKLSLGGSHQRLQYTGTNSPTTPMRLEFARSIFLSLAHPGKQRISDAEMARLQLEFETPQKFLGALCYPRGRASDVMRYSPPRALIIGPRNKAFIAVLTNLTITEDRFDEKYRVTHFIAECQWTLHRQFRTTSGEFREKGFMTARAISEKGMAG